ncbi:MAG: serine protease, partial [Pseudomonadota bacterium]
ASEAFEKGIRVGDLISEIGQQPVDEPTEVVERFEDAREAGRKSLLLLLQRDGQSRFVAVAPN